MKVKIPKKLKCERCGHRWTPRIEEIRVCPACKSLYWNVKNYKRKQYKKTRILAKETRTI